MKSGIQTDVIYTDISKAFDLVYHSLLIAKLKTYGISDKFLSWITSYLLNRFQYVKKKKNGFLSNKMPVPQKWHLSLLLFAISILDIGACFRYCKYQLLADELKMYASVITIDDHYKFKDDLNRFCN